MDGGCVLKQTLDSSTSFDENGEHGENCSWYVANSYIFLRNCHCMHIILNFSLSFTNKFSNIQTSISPY